SAGGTKPYTSELRPLPSYFRAVLVKYRDSIQINPKAASTHNDLAWLLTNCPVPNLRNSKEAVAAAERAVELVPKEGRYWNTLGVARYRNGDWKGTVEAIGKSIELTESGSGTDFYFLAMAHRQLGDKAEARKWFDKANQLPLAK